MVKFNLSHPEVPHSENIQVRVYETRQAMRSAAHFKGATKNFEARVICTDSHILVVFYKDGVNWPVISHELLHVALKLARKRRNKHCRLGVGGGDVEENIAYELMWLTETFAKRYPYKIRKWEKQIRYGR